MTSTLRQRTPAPAAPQRVRSAGGWTLREVMAAAIGALTIVGASTALTPLIEGWAFLVPIAMAVIAIYLVGTVSRALGLPVLVTESLQLFALAVSLTGTFLQSGIGGVIPGPAALREAVVLLQTAWQETLTTIPPAPATSALMFFCTLAIGLTAIIVDLLIAGSHTPALVAIPLLAIYSIPSAISTAILPWYAFVIPAAGFVALLAVAPVEDRRHHQHPATHRAHTGRAVAGTTIAAAISIVAAMAIASLTTVVGTEGRLPRGSASSGQVGLSPWALLRGELTNGDTVDVLSVAGLDTPSYLRTFTLTSWKPDQGFGLTGVHADTPDFDGRFPTDAVIPTTATTTSTARITAQGYRDRYLPLPPRTMSVSDLAPGWDYDSGLSTVFRGGAVTPAAYSATVAADTVTDAELRTKSVIDYPDLRDIGGQLPAEVTAIARSVTATATTPFDQVNALLRYFTDPANGFTYSLATPQGNSGNALVDFLQGKQGYCEQYAAAMAIMVRSLGIPARVAIGFTQGKRQSDGSYQVTSDDAHAWVEVPFADAGWVMFDPTPVVDGQGGLQGFTATGPGGSGAPTGTAATTNPTSGAPSTAPPSTSRSLVGATPTRAATLPTADLDPAAQAVQAWTIPTWVPVTLVVLAALGLLIATPRLLRGLRRRSRLRQAASGAATGSAEAAWREMLDTMRDHELPMAGSDSLRTTANHLAEAAQLPTAVREQLRGIVIAVERSWYGDEDLPPLPVDAAATTRAAIEGLRRYRPMSMRQRWWPRSLTRRH